MNMDESIGEERLAGAEHASPSRIARPGLFAANPMPRTPLARRGTQHILAALRPPPTDIGKPPIPNGLNELGAVGEPNPRGKVDVEHGRPVCSWIVFRIRADFLLGRCRRDGRARRRRWGGRAAAHGR